MTSVQLDPWLASLDKWRGCYKKALVIALEDYEEEPGKTELRTLKELAREAASQEVPRIAAVLPYRKGKHAAAPITSVGEEAILETVARRAYNSLGSPTGQVLRQWRARHVKKNNTKHSAPQVFGSENEASWQSDRDGFRGQYENTLYEYGRVPPDKVLSTLCKITEGGIRAARHCAVNESGFELESVPWFDTGLTAYKVTKAPEPAVSRDVLDELIAELEKVNELQEKQNELQEKQNELQAALTRQVNRLSTP